VTDKRDKIREELRSLASEGHDIWLVEEIRTKPELRASIEKRASDSKDPKEKTVASDLLRKSEKGDSFASKYQQWYSTALPVVEQLLPDRYREFCDLHRLERRKEIDVTTYTTSDYARGITLSRGDIPVFDHHATGLGRFKEQVEILGSAEARLDSLLTDIRGVLEADMFDDELDAAKDLLGAKHLRSAGIVAGVVLERHLKRLVANHKVTFRKKPQLGNLNEALKAAKVYDVPQWRQIQRLTDLRNLCGHDDERNPTSEEVEELIDGTAKIVATIF